jgi:hypothetical protein
MKRAMGEGTRVNFEELFVFGDVVRDRRAADAAGHVLVHVTEERRANTTLEERVGA